MLFLGVRFARLCSCSCAFTFKILVTCIQEEEKRVTCGAFLNQSVTVLHRATFAKQNYYIIKDQLVI